MKSFARGAPQRRGPDVGRIAIIVTMFLAVVAPAIWQTSRASAGIEQRRVAVRHEQAALAFTATLLLVVSDLGILRIAVDHPNAVHESIATLAGRVADALPTLAQPQFERQVRAASCDTTLRAWRAGLARASHDPRRADIQGTIAESVCLIDEAATHSMLDYDKDPTIQVLTSLVELDSPVFVRRIALAVGTLDAGTGQALTRRQVISIAGLLASVSRAAGNVKLVVEQDEVPNDPRLARELSTIEAPIEVPEHQFERASGTLLAAPLVTANGAREVARLAAASIRALLPLNRRANDEIAGRLAREDAALKASRANVIIVAIAGTSMAFIALVGGAALFERRQRREVARIERAYADQAARVHAERALSLTEGQLRAVFESSTAAIAILDDELRVGQHNAAFGDLRSSFPHVADVIAEQVRERFTSVGAPATGELHLEAPSLPACELSVSLAGVFENQRRVYIIVTLTDITSSKANERRLYADATHDGLTGLQNRKGFHARLASLAATPHAPLAIVFIDLDRFKPINDRFGHAAGDAVLVAVSSRLRGVVAADDCVARLGGDEFAAILGDVADHAVAAAIGQRMLAALEPPISMGSGLVSVSASIGIALERDTGPTSKLTDLTILADEAMYRAKVKGTGYAIAAAQPASARS